MKKNLDITKPRYREQILPVPSSEALRYIEVSLCIQGAYKANRQSIALLVTCYVTQTQQR